MDELAERLASVPRGLIVAGRQPDQGLAEPVVELAAAAGYPILAEPTSGLRRGRHDRSLVISTYDLIARARPESLAPELIVRVGDMPTSKALRQWLGSIGELRQVVLDPDGSWKEPSRRAETLVRADAAALASGLASRLKASAASPERAKARWPAAWRAAEAAAQAAVERELSALDELSEPGAWPALAQVLADGDAVLAASSMPVRDLETFLPPGPEAVRFLSNRGASGIDGLVSTAAGAAAAGGGRAWAVLGDLAVVHDLGGLAALRAAPGLRLLVLDNGGGGIFHFLPQAEAMAPDEFEALLGTPPPIDLVRAAELFGLSCEVPADDDGLAQALRGEARVVIMRTDRRANLELHRRIGETAAAAVASA
jgi:2-succinyl-5-enolpyruvyl-6-hydroxy-3-cyclohexene-1-carboxylate synthase